MIPVVLSGGSGSRLWPLSRQAKPKQFLALTDDLTMLQNTINRLDGVDGIECPIVVCNEMHRFLVAEQLRQIGSEHQGIILEPCARDTAPAICLAALHALKSNKDELLLILPADHVISDISSFQHTLYEARVMAEKGYLVTFGIKPTRPETGYGYIKAGQKITESDSAYQIDKFVEKPDYKTANNYISSGEYFWNGGMFLCKSSRFLEEMALHSPDVLTSCELALQKATKDFDFIRVNTNNFESSPSISMDYAVMEKTESAVVVPMDAGWTDLGAWSAIHQVLEKDKNGNACKGDVVLQESENCLVFAENRLVTLFGMHNAVVVETSDAIIVADNKSCQEVKLIVEKLKRENRSEATEHRQGFRPWGMYDCIDKGNRFQVKRITVKPGETLSLQLHHHRAEHWIVVSGTAKVRCGDKTSLLTENQSTFIPLGELHQLSNPGKFDLELIEVQSGAYLGEDDIERFDDEYGRA